MVTNGARARNVSHILNEKRKRPTKKPDQPTTTTASSQNQTNSVVHSRASRASHRLERVVTHDELATHSMRECAREMRDIQSSLPVVYITVVYIRLCTSNHVFMYTIIASCRRKKYAGPLNIDARSATVAILYAFVVKRQLYVYMRRACAHECSCRKRREC